MNKHVSTSPKIELPLSLIDRVDIARLLRELEALGNFLESAELRAPDNKPKMPKTSRLLDDILEQNKLDGLLKADRQRLEEFLAQVKDTAPVMHMSFSSDPSPAFAQKLVTWLREKIHPLVLLQLGLQPTIGAGCIVRTTNKQFDFSLRQRLVAERGVLIKKMRETPPHETPAAAAPAEAAAPPQQPAADQAAQPSAVPEPAAPAAPPNTLSSTQPVVPLKSEGPQR